jgi:hypothetical protein
MKSECTNRIIVPLRLDSMRHELACCATWFNEYRPHAGLGGRTPLEVYSGLAPAIDEARIEPRERWPHRDRIREEAGEKLGLIVRRFEGRPLLPIVELKRAA